MPRCQHRRNRPKASRRLAEYAKERITYGGVDYVELAVDTETGRVHIEKVFGAPRDSV